MATESNAAAAAGECYVLCVCVCVQSTEAICFFQVAICVLLDIRHQRDGESIKSIRTVVFSCHNDIFFFAF